MRGSRVSPLVPISRLVLGLFVFALFQGCVTVEIGKDVCKASGAGPGLEPPTGCFTQPWQGGSALGFIDVATGQPVTDPSLTCSGPNSRKCQTNPGSCGFGGRAACVTKYYSTTDNSCKCVCP